MALSAYRQSYRACCASREDNSKCLAVQPLPATHCQENGCRRASMSRHTSASWPILTMRTVVLISASISEICVSRRTHTEMRAPASNRTSTSNGSMSGVTADSRDLSMADWCWDIPQRLHLSHNALSLNGYELLRSVVGVFVLCWCCSCW